jgi:hypothetical protein
MKPDWDKLADELKENDKVLIADVDCTNEDNTELCEKYGVKGYPTIKSFVSGGDRLGETYEGERDFESLKKHATENLAPVCSDTNYGLCNAEEKAILDKYRALRWPARKKLIKDAEDKQALLEAEFDEKGKAVQDEIQAAEEAKNEKVRSIETQELRLLKTIIYTDSRGTE